MKTTCLLMTLVSVLLAPLTAEAMLVGQITVAGYGPEHPVVQDLARAFEKANPGVAVEVRWHRNLKAVQLVKSGRAEIAVTGAPDPELAATRIAWDGIALVVNFTNPIKSLSRDQAADLLGGNITRWSGVDGPDRIVHVITRPPDRNIDLGLREALALNGERPPNAETIRSDQRALSAVSGDDRAITYMSLKAALAAVRDGIPIKILFVDGVEPEEPTVSNGRYTLRRPVLLLTSREPDTVTRAFVDFARSPEGQRILRQMFVPVPEESALADGPAARASTPSRGSATRLGDREAGAPGLA